MKPLLQQIVDGVYEGGIFVNSLTPGRKASFSNFNLWIGILSASNEISVRWMSLYHIDDKLILVQVKKHYLSQNWARLVSPYGITRPQWVNRLKTEKNYILQITFSIAFPVRIGNVWISIKTSLNFNLKCQIDNEALLVQVMAWCRTGDILWPGPLLLTWPD